MICRGLGKELQLARRRLDFLHHETTFSILKPHPLSKISTPLTIPVPVYKGLRKTKSPCTKKEKVKDEAYYR